MWILTSDREPPYKGMWLTDFWDGTIREGGEPLPGANCYPRRWDGRAWSAKDEFQRPLHEATRNEIYWWEEENTYKGIDHLINNTTPTLEHAGSRNHYKDVVPGYEYMDIMEHVLGYEGVVAHLRGQIFKYQFRYGKKDEEGSESEKIAWYSARLDDVVKRKANGEFPIKR